MTRPPKRRFGDGAICSVLLKFLRPSKEVDERFPNVTANQRLDDLVAVRQDIITQGRHTYPAVYFTSPTFPGLQIMTGHRFLMDGPQPVKNTWTYSCIYSPLPG